MFLIVLWFVSIWLLLPFRWCWFSLHVDEEEADEEDDDAEEAEYRTVDGLLLLLLMFNYTRAVDVLVEKLRCWVLILLLLFSFSDKSLVFELLLLFSVVDMLRFVEDATTEDHEVVVLLFFVLLFVANLTFFILFFFYK